MAIAMIVASELGAELFVREKWWIGLEFCASGGRRFYIAGGIADPRATGAVR
jgi:hypothetical protein